MSKRTITFQNKKGEVSKYRYIVGERFVEVRNLDTNKAVVEEIAKFPHGSVTICDVCGDASCGYGYTIPAILPSNVLKFISQNEQSFYKGT